MKDIIKEIIREKEFKKSKSFYFMSGLPRAGSTLISSLLNQNPRIYSGPSSPVVPTMLAIENSLSQDELYLAYPKREQGRQIIASVLYNFYLDIDKPVIIDKNRSWVNRLNYIQGYFDIAPKVLYPVRSIKDILASFIAMHKRNPIISDAGRINFLDDMLIKNNIPCNDLNRCSALMTGGILGQSLDGLKQIFDSGAEHSIHLIEYDDLINDPETTINKIYEFLDEEPFKHDFNNISNINRENDSLIYGFKDMHDVNTKLVKRGIIPEEILPHEIIQMCEGAEFWRSIKTIDSFNNENVSSELDNDEFKIIHNN